jgi:hypothetical protein
MEKTDNALTKMIRKGIFAPEAVVEARLGICRACEFYNPKTGLCNDCHCIMLAKSRIASSKCPQNKWVAFRLPSKTDILTAKKNAS